MSNKKKIAIIVSSGILAVILIIVGFMFLQRATKNKMSKQLVPLIP